MKDLTFKTETSFHGEVLKITVTSWKGEIYSSQKKALNKIDSLKDGLVGGVYVLYKKDRDLGLQMYVGSTDNMYKRLQEHIREKDSSFDHVLIFLAEDLNIAHFKCLESIWVSKAKNAEKLGFFICNNKNEPKKPTCLSSVEHDVKEYREKAESIISHMNLNFFDDFSESSPVKKIEMPKIEKQIFYFFGGKKSGKPYSAVGDLIKENKFLVKSGSTATVVNNKSLSKTYEYLKNTLIKDGILVLNKDGSAYVFEKDYIFNSCSAAAAIVCGNETQGTIAWKTKDGRLVKEFYV